MLKVFAVHRGCLDEGGSTKAIFSTREKAVWYCKYLVRKDNRDHAAGVRRSRARDVRRGRKPYRSRDHIGFRRENHRDVWKSDSEIIMIREFEVH